MTQEEKQLLIIDLCGRLPYGVMVEIVLNHEIFDLSKYLHCLPAALENFKPYLRPMSSMTEEEYNSMSWEGCNHVINYSVKHGFQFVEITSFTIEILNWLNANHFDYRGLIEKGLGIEASEGMYKNE